LIRPVLELRADVRSMLHFLLAASLSHDLPRELLCGALELTGTADQESGASGDVSGGRGGGGIGGSVIGRGVFDAGGLFDLPARPRAELAALLATVSAMREGGPGEDAIYPRLRACLARVVARAFRRSVSGSLRHRRVASAVGVVDSKTLTPASIRAVSASARRASTGRVVVRPSRAGGLTSAMVSPSTDPRAHEGAHDDEESQAIDALYGNLLEVSALE
jgi:hypothetical protein